MTEGTALLHRHLNGETLTEQERQALSEWVCASPMNAKLVAELTNLDQTMTANLRNQASTPLMDMDESDFSEQAPADNPPAQPAVTDMTSATQRGLMDAELLDLLQRIESNGEDLDPMALAAKRFPPKPHEKLSKKDWAMAGRYVLEHYVTPRRVAYAAAAVVLLAASLLVFFLASGPEPTETAPVAIDPPETRPAPKLPPIQTVATLTDQVNAHWRYGDLPVELSVGTTLSPQQRLTLTRGFAQITTQRGATALLQAPCTIELTDSDNAIRLHHGKLVGRCETAESKGFVVYMPGMDVVDLGTEFGVQADAAGGSTVLVMEGEVRARPTVESPQAFEPVVLVKNQARRSHPETGSLEMIAVSEAPVFYAEVPHPYERTVREASPALWLRQNNQDPVKLLGAALFHQAGQGFGKLELHGRGCVDAGDVLDFDADQPFSISVWVRPQNDHGDMFLLGRVAKNNDRGFHGYDLYLKNQRLRMQLMHAFEVDGTADSQIRVESAKRLDIDQWQHVIATYDGSRRASGVKLYINGVAASAMVRDDTLDSNSIRANSKFRIGIRGFTQPRPELSLDGLTTQALAAHGSPMVGSVGDLVVFKRVLDVVEIRSLHKFSREAYTSPSGGF